MARFRCIMGCKIVPSQSLHCFPRDSQRRAEWCRILRVYPMSKLVYLCNAHFSPQYIFGAKVSKFALPNPPDSRTLNNVMVAMRNGKARYQIQKIDPIVAQPEITENTMSALFHDDSVTSFPETEVRFPASNMTANNLEEDPLQDNSNNSQFSSEAKIETAHKIKSNKYNCNIRTPSNAENGTGESHETFNKVDDFEIRKGSNKDMIIKGRYVQTNDYLVVSYTPPRKWALQEQVKILDKTCTHQLQQIRQLHKDKYRLSVELKKHEKLLPKVQLMQTHIRYLNARLKTYEIREKNRRKRIKEQIFRNNKGASLEKNNVDI